jgi:Helix-turn-helix domain
MSGRFAIVPAAWLDDPRIGLAEIGVLVILSAHADKRGWCHPNQQTMANMLKKSRPWVTDVIGSLADMGFIEIKSIAKTGKRNSYRLLMDRFLDQDDQCQPTDIECQPAEVESQPADIQENNTIRTIPEEQKERVSAKPTFPSSQDLEWAVGLYNSMATKAGLSKVRILTEARRRKLRATLQRLGSRDAWHEVIDGIYGSDFCRGRNDRGWRADFDFALQEKSLPRILEGFYEQRSNA